MQEPGVIRIHSRPCPERLARCYRRCLSLATEQGVSAITFPSIGTASFFYPLTKAAEIAIREVSPHSESQEGTSVMHAHSTHGSRSRNPKPKKSFVFRVTSVRSNA